MPRQASQIQVGVVGCGSISQIIHLPLLYKSDAVKLVSLCDMDVRKASIIANRFDIPNVYGDIEEMLENHSLDLIFILTPNNLHLPMSLMALKSGANLFIEKPAARNSKEALRIAETAREQNCHVMVGMQNRFRSDVQAIKSFLDAREFGELLFAKAGWLQAVFHSTKQPWIYNKSVSGGGVLLDLGVQLIDLVWFLLGKPGLKSVKGDLYQIRDEIEIEDSMVSLIQFNNNVSAFAEFSWDFPISKDRFYLEIIGKTGTCTLNPLRVQKIWNGQILNITPESKENNQMIFKRSYETEIKHYIHFLQGRLDSLESTIDDAVEVLKITDEIYRSIEASEETILRNDNKGS